MELKQAQERLDKCMCGLGVLETYGWYTTFWNDFKIAKMFGREAIEDTFNRAWKEWKNDILYVTELYVVICWLADDEKIGSDLRQWYYKQKEMMDNYIFKHYKGEELQYFIRFTD